MGNGTQFWIRSNFGIALKTAIALKLGPPERDGDRSNERNWKRTIKAAQPHSLLIFNVRQQSPKCINATQLSSTEEISTNQQRCQKLSTDMHALTHTHTLTIFKMHCIALIPIKSVLQFISFILKNSPFTHFIHATLLPCLLRARSFFRPFRLSFSYH